MKEHEDASCQPEIVLLPDLSGIDEIWIGYPIWWYTHPRIIKAFFGQAELARKIVHLFATSGGNGISVSLAELRSAYPGINSVDGNRK